MTDSARAAAHPTPERSPLVSVQELSSMSPPPVLLDCSHDLADPEAGQRAWEAGHLPGSRHLHLDTQLSGQKTGHNGRHPLPEREAVRAWMAALGIVPERQVVVFDGQGNMFAARAWWVLRWMGHQRVRVLDGGIGAWVREGGALVTGEPPSLPKPSVTPPDSQPAMPTIDAGHLLANLNQLRVVDARAPERYRGEVEPLDRVAGHIPGAVNRFFKDNLQADGRFKSPEDLREEFTGLLAGQPISASVMQCGSGVTACHHVLAFEVAGLGTPALYPGSWSEWASDPSRPVAVGHEAGGR